MLDPYLAGISRRSRNSTRPSRYWITTVDGSRLREARLERGLSRGRLAAEAGISVRTMARLESQEIVSCHRATLHRIAATLGDDPRSVIAMLVVADIATDATEQSLSLTAPATSWLGSRVFEARPDQVAEARSFVGRLLHGCPLLDDAQLICSELVTNAIKHSRSALPGGRVTVRAEVCHRDYIWLEVEDQGGDWVSVSQDGDGGRGLEIVAALADYWDVRGDQARRTAYARLDWPEPATPSTEPPSDSAAIADRLQR